MRSKSHQAKQCTSSSCKTCGLKHNTLLHLTQTKSDNNSTTKEAQSAKAITESSKSSAVITHNLSGPSENYALLSTALVHVFDIDANKLPCRVLLDAGAQVNLITRDFVSKLRIKTKQHNMSIVGIDQITTCSNQIVTNSNHATINSKPLLNV